MGRTNPTYRNRLDSLVESFKPFRRALREQYRPHLDSLWEKAHRHASAAAYMNSSSPGLPAMISIMVGLQQELEENRERIAELEERLDEVD